MKDHQAFVGSKLALRTKIAGAFHGLVEGSTIPAFKSLSAYCSKILSCNGGSGYRFCLTGLLFSN